MTEDWLRDFEEFEDTADGWAMDLRLSLADIIVKHLRQLGWSQKALAERVGTTEARISALVHGESNCTFDTAARILHALGVKADLVEPYRIRGESAFSDFRVIVVESWAYGTEEIEQKIEQEGGYEEEAVKEDSSGEGREGVVGVFGEWGTDSGAEGDIARWRAAEEEPERIRSVG